MTEKQISLILPTRERRLMAEQTLASAARTADRPQAIEAVLYLDLDDPDSHSIACDSIHTNKLIGPRSTMGLMIQECYEASRGRYLLLANDDLCFRTPGWDSAFLKALARFPDDVALVWANDLFWGRKMPTHPALSRTTCAVLGQLCPTAYLRDYIDTHLYDIFRRLRQKGHDRLIFLPDVVIEHASVDSGKRAPDNLRLSHHAPADEITYTAMAEERQRLARELASFIKHHCGKADADR